MLINISLLLDKHAHWFVVGAWLLCPIVIIAVYKIGVGIIIADAYRRDYQLVYPIHKTIIAVLGAAVVTSLVVAIFASITLAIGKRAVASGFIVGVYFALLGGSSLALVLAPRGPQEIFQRHVGRQLYNLPRHNKPPNEATAGGGFDFVVCLTPFDERDRSRCQSSTLVSVRPREVGLVNWSDVRYCWWPCGRRAPGALAGTSNFARAAALGSSPRLRLACAWVASPCLHRLHAAAGANHGAACVDRWGDRHHDACRDDPSFPRSYGPTARRRTGNDDDLRLGDARCHSAAPRASWRRALSPHAVVGRSRMERRIRALHPALRGAAHAASCQG